MNTTKTKGGYFARMAAKADTAKLRRLHAKMWRDLAAARKTLRDYASRIEEAEAAKKKAARRCAEYADLYEHLFCMAVNRLTDEEREKHRAFKSRLLRRDTPQGVVSR